MEQKYRKDTNLILAVFNAIQSYMTFKIAGAYLKWLSAFISLYCKLIPLIHNLKE